MNNNLDFIKLCNVADGQFGSVYQLENADGKCSDIGRLMKELRLLLTDVQENTRLQDFVSKATSLQNHEGWKILSQAGSGENNPYYSAKVKLETILATSNLKFAVTCETVKSQLHTLITNYVKNKIALSASSLLIKFKDIQNIVKDALKIKDFDNEINTFTNEYTSLSNDIRNGMNTIQGILKNMDPKEEEKKQSSGRAEFDEMYENHFKKNNKTLETTLFDNICQLHDPEKKWDKKNNCIIQRDKDESITNDVNKKDIISILNNFFLDNSLLKEPKMKRHLKSKIEETLTGLFKENRMTICKLYRLLERTFKNGTFDDTSVEWLVRTITEKSVCLSEKHSNNTKDKKDEAIKLGTNPHEIFKNKKAGESFIKFLKNIVDEKTFISAYQGYVDYFEALTLFKKASDKFQEEVNKPNHLNLNADEKKTDRFDYLNGEYRQVMVTVMDQLRTQFLKFDDDNTGYRFYPKSLEYYQLLLDLELPLIFDHIPKK